MGIDLLSQLDKLKTAVHNKGQSFKINDSGMFNNASSLEPFEFSNVDDGVRVVCLESRNRLATVSYAHLPEFTIFCQNQEIIQGFLSDISAAWNVTCERLILQRAKGEISHGKLNPNQSLMGDVGVVDYSRSVQNPTTKCTSIRSNK